MNDLQACDDERAVIKRLVDGMVDHAIFMLDTDGLIRTWNAGAERLKGYRREEIVGRHFSIFYSEEDRQAGVPDKALASALKQGRATVHGWRVRKNGSRFWACVDIQPVRGDDGKLTGFAKITRDETDRKAIEALREQLTNARKVETLAQLTAGLAHEFNNLLAAIAGGVELMARYGGQERISRVADVTHHAVDRGRTLVTQLLDHTRNQWLQPKPSDLNEVIASFEPFLREAATDAVALTFRYAVRCPSIDIDHAQLQAALLNLVSNARAASLVGATIAVATELVRPGQYRQHGCDTFLPGDYVSISVTDRGHGMTDLVRERAIEPFFTSRPPGRPPGAGPGLGLSQVHGFVRQSGGVLRIESQVSEGTTVRLLLPALPEARRRPATILVVEDDARLRCVVVETLRERGYDIVAAADALTALGVLATGRSFDLMFSDLVMPGGMDGLELARLARKQRPHMRLLLTSGFAASIQSMRSDLEGIHFLPKPYRDSELHESIDGLLSDQSQAGDGRVVEPSGIEPLTS